MRLKKLISTFLIITLIGNTNVFSFYYAFAGVAFLISSANAYADPPEPPSQTPKLDELKNKYELNNPTRNHQSDTLPTKVQQQIASPGASRDLTPIISNTLTNPTPSRTIPLNQYFDPSNPATFNSQRDLALSLSKTHGAPSGNVTTGASGDSISSVNLEYNRKGTRQFVRGPDGKLVLKVVDGGERVSGVQPNDLFSNEYGTGHPGYSFEGNKQSLYGNDEGIFVEGKSTHDTFKDPTTGNSASARGYRAVTDGAMRAIQQPSPLLLLQQSFNTLQNTQDPNLWLSSCSTQTVPSTSVFTSTTETEHFCQDTGQSNFDFCEVERNIKIPVYSSTPGLRSCGVGCYEFDLNVDVWKTSRCRSTSGGDAQPATFTLMLNLSHGIAIKNVEIKGEAHDHFLYTLNGQKLWESSGKSQGPTGNYLGGSCNISGHSHKINTNVTSRVNSIVGPLASEGVYSLTFRGDIRWKRNGGMASTVRFEIEDTSGEGLETTFIQYPEGCYDALTLEDKLLRGLNGVYDWAEYGIDPTLPPLRYECVSPPRQPQCPSGEIPFGSAGQELCYGIPKPPICPAGLYNDETDRCEYPATIVCPSGTGIPCGTQPNGFPKYPVALEVAQTGMICTYTDPEHCGSWSHTLPAEVTCPAGGTPDGSLCVIPADKSEVCDIENGYSYHTVTIEGVEYQRCQGPVTSYTPNTWQCESVDGEPQTYSSTYCAITYEDYRDEDGNPIPTIDENGFPISPPFYDDEGEEIAFRDVAKCLKPQSLPDVEPVDLPQSFCTFDEYEIIDEGDRGFPVDLLSGIPNFFDGDTGNKTWKVNLKKYRCDPSKGRIMCFPDPDTGEEKCYDWEDLKNLPDRCASYKQDDRCSEVSRECTEGWLEPISGRCMAETVTYRCADETVINYETTREINTCESMLPCVGGNCDIGEKEQNENFVKAMVAGSIIDNIQGDSACEDPSDPSTCRIFQGEYKYCSWEVTGLGTNCCEEAKGVDILGYITFTRQLLKVNQMAYSGAFGQGVAGNYQTLAQPVVDGYQAISNWAMDGIRSATESIFGNAASSSAGGAVSAISEGISAALSALQQQTFQFVYNMLPDALAQMIFQETANVAAGEASKLALQDSVGNFVSGLMAVYAVYSLAKLALTLLTACDEHEMDMGIKLAQRQCFKVGPTYCNKRFPVIGGLGACMQRRQDYCCYSSILARIIVKESYSQLGINPLPFGNKLNAGTPEAKGSCLGLTAEQLSSLDFNAPSMQTALEEWIGLLIQSGAIPTETSEQSLTGGATTEDASCPPQQKPVLFCYIEPETEEQICEHSRDAQGNLLYETIPSECVKKLNPGQIWNAEDRKPATERITGDEGYLHGAQDRVMESKNEVRNIINNLDCSVVPRPPVCRFLFNPIED